MPWYSPSHIAHSVEHGFKNVEHEAGKIGKEALSEVESIGRETLHEAESISRDVEKEASKVFRAVESAAETVEGDIEHGFKDVKDFITNSVEDVEWFARWGMIAAVVGIPIILYVVVTQIDLIPTPGDVKKRAKIVGDIVPELKTPMKGVAELI